MIEQQNNISSTPNASSKDTKPSAGGPNAAGALNSTVASGQLDAKSTLAGVTMAAAAAAAASVATAGTSASGKSADIKYDANGIYGAATDLKDLDAKLKQYEEAGVICKVKLIGEELVMDPRGDKMCQNSIQRLKAIIKGTKGHKRKIVLKISYDGVKIYDEKTNEILHHHKVPQISYVVSDETDQRTFGYVCDVPNNAHLFICFKTMGPALKVMTIISDLFEAVLQKKKRGETEPSTQSRADNEPQHDLFHHEALEPKTKYNSEIHQSKPSELKFSKPIVSDDLEALKDIKLIGDLDNVQIIDSTEAALRASSASQFSITSTSPGNSDFQQRFHPRDFSQSANNTAVLSSLPRDSPIAQHNRSLVYNHSSVSLGDFAGIGRQNSSQQQQSSMSQAGLGFDSSSGTDRYAVFNDIDNLPSIFESASINSDNTTNKQSSLQQIGNNNKQFVRQYSQQQQQPIRPFHSQYSQPQAYSQQNQQHPFYAKQSFMMNNNLSSMGNSLNDSFMSSQSSQLNSSLEGGMRRGITAPNLGNFQQIINAPNNTPVGSLVNTGSNFGQGMVDFNSGMMTQNQPQIIGMQSIHNQQQLLQQQQYGQQQPLGMVQIPPRTNTKTIQQQAPQPQQQDVFTRLNPFDDEFFA